MKFVLALMLATQCAAQQSVSLLCAPVKCELPPSAEALSEVGVFRTVSKSYPLAAAPWKWVMVVDDHSWHELLKHEHYDESGYDVYGVTDLKNHITYFRGQTLIHPDGRATPDLIISHEMAHVYLNSGNEKLVEKTAATWRFNSHPR